MSVTSQFNSKLKTIIDDSQKYQEEVIESQNELSEHIEINKGFWINHSEQIEELTKSIKKIENRTINNSIKIQNIKWQ